jgi:hypothetical protein
VIDIEAGACALEFIVDDDGVLGIEEARDKETGFVIAAGRRQVDLAGWGVVMIDLGLPVGIDGIVAPIGTLGILVEDIAFVKVCVVGQGIGLCGVTADAVLEVVAGIIKLGFLYQADILFGVQEFPLAGGVALALAGIELDGLSYLF